MKPAVAEPRSAPRASYTTSTDSTKGITYWHHLG